MRFSARLVLSLCCIGILFCSIATMSNAQTPKPLPTQQPTQTTQQQSPASTYYDFRTPNVDLDVPRNSHTYAQIVLIDVLSAIDCQLIGVDATNPQQPCIGLNPYTGKFSVVPTQQQLGQGTQSPQQVGGAVGFVGTMIGSLYTPSISSSQYFQYLSSNFGIVKSAYANPLSVNNSCSETPLGYGFCGLYAVFQLWIASRNIAYVILTIIFILLGVGIMLRFKVDPRTVMTIQNQIPRVIIAILLITFSYAIAGIMIDIMWTVTYAGVGIISDAAPNSKITTCTNDNASNNSIKTTAPQRLIDQPMSFMNAVYLTDCAGSNNGLFSLSDKVGKNIGAMIYQVIAQLLGLNPNAAPSCGWTNWDGCLGAFTLWLTKQLVKLVVIIAILVSLFKLWWTLGKTYLIIFFKVILFPLQIILGLVPGQKTGFMAGFQGLFVDLAIYPIAVFILLCGRIMMDSVPTEGISPQSSFIPPLIGNSNASGFGALLGFFAILLAPSVIDNFKKQAGGGGGGGGGGSPFGTAIAAGIGYGAGAVGNPIKHMGKKISGNLWRRDQYGNAAGILSTASTNAFNKIPILGRRSQQRKAHYTHRAQATASGTESLSARQFREFQGFQTQVPQTPITTATGQTYTPPPANVGDWRGYQQWTRNQTSAARPAGTPPPNTTPWAWHVAGRPHR